MELTPVNFAELADAWPYVKDDLAKAIEYSNGRYTEKIIVDALMINLMQLWAVVEDGTIKTSFITRVTTYPTGKRVCEVFLLGGSKVGEWLDFATEHLSKWAESIGCSALEMTGRPGWQRVLKGWGTVSVTMEKPLRSQS